jgi:hypothetical protein
MYTNIPKIGVINIIKKILENNNEIEKNIQKETIEQNYFQFDQEYYKHQHHQYWQKHTYNIWNTQKYTPY